MFIKLHREGFEALPISLQQHLLGQPLLGKEASRRGRADHLTYAKPCPHTSEKGHPLTEGPGEGVETF